MPTAFPGAADTFTNPNGAVDTLASLPHDAQHGSVNDAIEALEAKVGITASTPDSNKVLLGTGVGASAWSDAATVRTALGLVIGTNVQAYATVPSYDGIQFPATQVPSAGANVLDDYEEGTFTAVLTFATAGDVNVVYASQTGRYTKIGHRVFWAVNIQTTTFTHTTASGAMRVTGLPFTAASGNHFGVSAIIMRGWTKASVSSLAVSVAGSATYFEVYASITAAVHAALATTDMPTGGTVHVLASGSYNV